MGSGKRFRCTILEGWGQTIGLGLWIAMNSEHKVSINLTLLILNIYIGLGKGYDE